MSDIRGGDQSDTAPVREVIKPSETGLLVDFFDGNQIADQVTYLLQNPMERYRLSKVTRDFVIRNYQLEKICLAKQKLWVGAVIGKPSS